MDISYTNRLNQSIIFKPPCILTNKIGLGGVKNIITTQKSAFQDGETFKNSNLDIRQITLIGAINAINDEEMESLRQKLYTVFNPKIEGTLYVNDKCLDVVIEEAPSFDFDKPLSKKILYFAIYAKAVNPFLKDITDTITPIVLWQPKFEFGVWGNLRPEGIELGVRMNSLFAKVVNNGAVDCPLKLEFIARGTLENPEIVVVGTKQFIRINKEMQSGEKIVIDTAKDKTSVTQYLRGQTKEIDYCLDYDSTWIQLPVGTTLLRYGTNTNLDNLEVRIHHRNLYLGV